jgi:hypothetical protein
MTETNPTSEMTPAAAPLDAPIAKRSRLTLAANLLVQLFLIAILAIIIFVMWLPAIVSKR